MQHFEKLLQLKQLYLLRLVGHQYADLPRKNTLSSHDYLPNDLNALADIVRHCSLCELSKTRKCAVFGEGNPNAEILFVGEGPGAMEDETGRPFVGRAGELLTKIIENVLELPRQEVFIANIVKCRPPGNRVPTPSEATACRPYLLRQIELIRPRILVALGATSYHYLTEDTAPIGTIHGQVIPFWEGITLIPTFHPSYLLRNPSAKRDAYHDFLKVKQCL